MPKALITGITGQDGQLLFQDLIEHGYDVVGTSRGNRCADELGVRIESRGGRILPCDYSRQSIDAILESECPDEVYNLAGQAYVGKSWLKVEETLESVAGIPARLLESIAQVNPAIKYFQASTSQIYAPSDAVLTESSRFGPNTPYGCSKMYAHFITQSFRETRGLFAVNGILFNHESPLRKDDFFLQKVVLGAVSVSQGRIESVDLGDLEVSRDMGCAREYMGAVRQMMQADRPSDFNVCTGIATKLSDLVNYVFERLSLDPEKHVKTNRNLIRRYEPPLIVGSHEKITKDIGWRPQRSIREVLDEMLESAQNTKG